MYFFFRSSISIPFPSDLLISPSICLLTVFSIKDGRLPIIKEMMIATKKQVTPIIKKSLIFLLNSRLFLLLLLFLMLILSVFMIRTPYKSQILQVFGTCNVKVNLSFSYIIYSQSPPFTTYVPAILSCQPCLSLSMAIQIKPKKKGISEIRYPRYLTSAFL